MMKCPRCDAEMEEEFRSVLSGRRFSRGHEISGAECLQRQIEQLNGRVEALGKAVSKLLPPT